MARRLRNWCFTAYDLDAFDVPVASPDLRYCVYQTEVCPNTQRPHIQGYIEFNKAVAFATVKALLGDPTVHLEARRGTRVQARDYCLKDESRMEGTDPIQIGTWDQKEGKREDLNEARKLIHAHNSWTDVINDPELTSVNARYGKWTREQYEHRPVEIPAPDIVLRTWQVTVCDLLDEAVKKRRVIWIWSVESSTGKTTMFDYASSRFNVLPGGDYANVLYAYDNHSIIWFDLSRHQTHDHIPYHAIEKLSNQTVHTSTKYVPCRKYVSAHIVVTANIAPDESKLPNRCVVIYATPPGDGIQYVDD